MLGTRFNNACFGNIEDEKRIQTMSIGDILIQIYNAGILILAIVALAIAIIVYPTLRSRSGKLK